LNGNTSTWLGSSSASVAANSNGWTALNTESWDDTSVSSRLRPSSYLVQASSNGGVSWANSVSTNSATTSYTYRSLVNGTPYVFRVAPYYSATATVGEWTSQSPTYTPALAPPGQPTSLVATSGNGRATLSWVAPSSVGDSAISGYRIEYSTNGGGSWLTLNSNTWSTSTSQSVTGLTNGTSYVFRVAAINSSATGSYSASATAVPKDPNLPAAPLTLTASPGDRQAVLQWSPVTSRYLNGYRIEYSTNSGSTWWTITSNTFSTATTV
jgi:titin